MRLTWLGAAGFRVETVDGAVFLLDPFLSRPEAATPLLTIQLSDLFPVDEIFLTDGRFDHVRDTPALVEQTGAIVHAPPAVVRRLAGLGLSPHSLQPAALHKPKRLGRLSWRAVAGRGGRTAFSVPAPALRRERSPVTRSGVDLQGPAGESIAYFFQSDRASMIYFGHAGWRDSAIRHIRPDVALLPVENRPTATSAVIRLAARLAPKLIIPHHWDDYHPPLTKTIDLTDFEAVIQSQMPYSRVYQPAIGRPVDIVTLLEQL